MECNFVHTGWREIGIDHPADWELTFVSKYGDPGQCTFADRRHERMKIQWRTLKFVPNLKKMLEEKKRKEEQNIQILKGQPTSWYGVVEKVAGVRFVHAGRFFEESKTLVEAILIWPGRRERKLENRILSHVRLAGDTDERHLWQAMGLKMHLAREFKLLQCQPDLGRVTWHFGVKEKKVPPLRIRRIAVPKYWLHMPLEEWLESELEPGRQVTLKRRFLYNGHNAARVVSEAWGGAWAFLRGRRAMRVDVAWRCPVEERVYHLRYDEATSSPDVDLPSNLDVECCKPYHFWGEKGGSGR